jgi:hypothetical protein
MDSNLVAWMIARGLLTATPSARREQENLRAFLESRREDHVSLIERLRGIGRPKTADIDLVRGAV